MTKELIGVETYEPSCVAAGQNSTLFMGWKHGSDVATAAVLGTAATQKHCRVQSLFKSLCSLLSSDTFPLTLPAAQQLRLCYRAVKNGDSFPKHDLPSWALPPLHILLSSLLPVHSSLFFYVFTDFFIHSRPCLICLICTHCYFYSLWHRYIKSLPSSSIYHTVFDFDPVHMVSPTTFFVHIPSSSQRCW
jgi:hypothetical protein